MKHQQKFISGIWINRILKNENLIIILLVGLILRLISLNQSLWLDEGIQWWAVTTFPFKHLITEYIKGDFNPPLYHAITFFWVRIFGSSEISLRLPSVLLGVGTIWFVYKIGNLLFENSLKIKNWKLKISETAALLTATGPLLIYYSQEARMYSLTAFLVMGTLHSLYEYRKHPSRLLAIRYCLFASLMLYSHYLTWILLPVLLVLLTLPTLLSVLSFLPFLPTFIAQLNQGVEAATNPAWASLSEFSAKSVMLVPIKFLIGRLPVDFSPAYIALLFIPLSLSAYLFYKSRHKQLIAFFFTPLILGALISIKVPIFTYFRFLYLVPILYLIITHGINKLPKKYQAPAAGFFLALNLLTASYYLLATSNHREDWKSATRYIHKLNLQAPVIIYAPVKPPFDYYNHDQSMIISENQLDQLIGQSDTWFISYAQPIFDPKQKIKATLENLGFQEISQRHFRGITVIRYKNLSAKLFSLIPIR